MVTLRHLELTTGRAFALLAALMVALLPALPAAAHLHAPPGLALKIAPHVHLDAAIGTTAGDASDHHERGGQPEHACDCCCLTHVPVLPISALAPLPLPVPSTLAWAADGAPPPDALAERQPEPPRPAA